MDNFSHYDHFAEIVTSFITSNCDAPRTCSPVINRYLIKFFVRCRIFHSVKFINANLEEDRHREKDQRRQEKLKKITNK